MLFSQKPKDATSATEQKNEKAKKAKTVAPKNKSVITVGKKKYAVGILWQPFRSLSAKNAEIKEASKFNKTNLFCVKNKGIPQYGLASTKEGYSSGMATGAGAVANVLSDKSSSVSMFKVNIGWWMVVIRNDLILPEEDKIFTDEEEAKKAFTAMLTVPDWGYRICPESWQVPDSKEIPIEQLLTGKIPNITLQNLDNTMTHLIIFAVIAGIAGIGFKVIMDKKKQQEAELQRQLEEARRIQMEQERKKKEEEQRLANMPVPPAWEKIIDPKKFTEVCIEHVRRNFQIFAGWGLKSITCEQTGVKVEWVRGDMGTFVEYQTARAMRDAAKQEGGLAGLGAGVAFGNTIAQNVQNVSNESHPVKSKAELLREVKSLFDEGILTQEEFEAEKKQILAEK